MKGNDFDARIATITEGGLKSKEINTIQVNLGLYCNQECAHCHLYSSPSKKEQMDLRTMHLVLGAVRDTSPGLVDLTGGAPELNPHFVWFIESLLTEGIDVQVRTNLTVLYEEGQDLLPRFFSTRGVHLVASLPCYLEDNVTSQRGKGVYRKSVEAIKTLNEHGYGIDPRLPLHLVYNPGGPFLPPPQNVLEDDYRRELGARFGIQFTRLITITNMPIGRYLERLRETNSLQKYMDLLKKSFNSETIDGLMCRHLISIAWDGTIHDCDFNLAIGLRVDHGAPDHVTKFEKVALKERRIVTGDHCFGCTAGRGSSCGGELLGKTPDEGFQ